MHARSVRLVLAFLFMVAGEKSSAQDSRNTVSPRATCDAIRMLRLPDVRITSVTQPRDSALARGPIRVPHCRVTGVIGKATEFVVVLPDAWNKRLVMSGNGGYAGSIGSLASANNGYMTTSTTTGHKSSPGGGARWALNDPEAVIQYGYLAVHQTVEVAKVIGQAYYGSEPAYAYFNGCSNGGRQALMEAQRFPNDFNGIIAGAPAIPMTTVGLSFLKDIKAAFPDTSYFRKPLITQVQLDLLASSVLTECDALDGVRDSIIADPRDCHFRLSSIRSCPANSPSANCLTAQQRNAIASIYAPLKDAKGRQIFPGQTFGGENLDGGWSSWITGSDTALMREVHLPSAQAMFLTEGARYMYLGDSTWSHVTERGELSKTAWRMVPILDAIDPDLSRFATRNGKLILYHGWSDPALNAQQTIAYHDSVLARDAKAREYMRLYLLPGVLHCGGGTGPAAVAWLDLLQKWVEEASPPERITATQRQGNRVIRTRPLCPYPQRAAYSGQGDSNDEKSFVCRAP